MSIESLVLVDHIYLRAAPSDENHGVRLKDLRDSSSNFSYQGIPMVDLFPDLDLSAALDKTAIYVETTGVPVTARNSQDKSTGVIGIRNGDFCYLDSRIIKNWSIGMEPGTQYWLSDTGLLVGTAPTSSATWVIRLGIAINTKDLLVSLSVTGKL